jgi:DNA-binding response OmpR family regulator
LSGIEILRRIRRENRFTPVILLTARYETFDKVAGLDHGANDYVTKPFEIEELLARIRVCLRNYPKRQSTLTVEDLIINTETREVTRDGKSISLTPKEHDLLVYLVINKNKVVTRENILIHVWGYEFEGSLT